MLPADEKTARALSYFIAESMSIFPSPSLKRSSDRKSESVPLTRQENSGQFLGYSELGVRIVEIDQAKRNIHDRDLDAKLDTDARLKVAYLAKRRLIDVKQRVLLNLAAEIELINTGGRACRASKPVTAAEQVAKLGLGQKTIIVIKQ